MQSHNELIYICGILPFAWSRRSRLPQIRSCNSSLEACVAKTKATGRGRNEKISGARLQKSPEHDLEGLYAKPEFLIRRAHQVASAAFEAACASVNLTLSQYAVMFALRQYASLSQNRLGRLVSLDRSTTSVVVKVLRERNLLLLSADPVDRRKAVLQLSDEGRLVLAKAERLTADCGRAMLSMFDQKHASDLMAMLRKIGEPDGEDSDSASRRTQRARRA